jgi:agmatinase
MGVLFIDAHADFACEGEQFKYSHRSIARNIVEEIPAVKRLVEVGVRDVDKAEAKELLAHDRVEVFYSEHLAAKRFEGACWGDICREVVDRLPQKVYVSFDIDALKIEFCNNTNAPVPGGMTFDEVVYLINTIVVSGREIVGFDISEVVSSLDNKMDAIVAAKLLAKLSMAAIKSAKRK